jgi:hypothetical protein
MNGEPLAVPMFIQRSEGWERGARIQIGMKLQPHLTPSRHRHIHTNWMQCNTQAFGLFSYWLLVVGCPGNSYCFQNPPPHSPSSMTKQNTGSGRQCGKTMGTQPPSVSRYMLCYVDTLCGLCVLLPGHYSDHVKPETLYNRSEACQLIGSRVQTYLSAGDTVISWSQSPLLLRNTTQKHRTLR